MIQENIESNHDLEASFLEKRGCVVRTINSLGRTLNIPPPKDLLFERQEQIKKADRFLLNLETQLAKNGSGLIERLKALFQAGEKIYRWDVKEIYQLLSRWLSNSPITCEIISIRSGIDRGQLLELIRKASQNPHQQIALIIPSHMAHIKASGDGRIIFLSDLNNEGKPVAISETDFLVLLTLTLREKREGELLIFYEGEELVLRESLPKIGDDFFGFSLNDPDYQKAKSLIDGLFSIKKPQETRVFGLRIYDLRRHISQFRDVYPYPTFFDWDARSIGRLTAREAAILGALARKAALLEFVFHRLEITEETRVRIVRILRQMNSDFPVYLLDVAEGILSFCRFLAEISDSERLKNIFTPDPDHHVQRLLEAYRNDGNELGINCVREVSSLSKNFPIRPYAGETREEREERKRSRDLGVEIASSFYLSALEQVTDEDLRL